MLTRNFPDFEILDLMEQPLHHVYFCKEVKGDDSYANFGIKAPISYEGKNINAVIFRSKKELAIADSTQPATSGTLDAYFMVKDVSREEFTSDVRVISDGMVYKVEYVQLYYDRRIAMLHRTTLNQAEQRGISPVIPEIPSPAFATMSADRRKISKVMTNGVFSPDDNKTLFVVDLQLGSINLEVESISLVANPLSALTPLLVEVGSDRLITIEMPGNFLDGTAQVNAKVKFL
jgi:hypothetical protein